MLLLSIIAQLDIPFFQIQWVVLAIFEVISVD